MSSKQAGSRSLPQLRASTVIFDIDDTITTATDNEAGGDVLSTLVKLVAQANHLREADAWEKICAMFNPETEPPDRYYGALGITERQLWDALMEWFPRSYTGLADAAAAIQELHARGFRLVTGTTNSNLICRLKLQVAGLGGYEGSPYFIRLLGGAEVHPKGKTTPEFFENLLSLVATQPDEVVHVGDNPQADLALAKLAGVTQVVLPRRGQAEEWVREADGGIYVKSLTLLPEMVQLIKRRKE